MLIILVVEWGSPPCSQTSPPLRARDHTLLGGDRIFSLHLDHQWLDESTSERLIRVWRSTKDAGGVLRRARAHRHARTVWRPDASFLRAASAGRHVALMAETQAAYWWADLASIHFTQAFFCPAPRPLSSPLPATHKHSVRWWQQGLETCRCNKPERKATLHIKKFSEFLFQFYFMSLFFTSYRQKIWSK